MTSASSIIPSPPATPPQLSTVTDADHQRVRLELKPDGPVTGHVDGGWWPRSRRLHAELPGLIAALRARLGTVEAVSYHLGEWQSPPSSVDVGGVAVRLGGYRLQRAGSLDVIARDRRVTLLVVDPEETEQFAGAALAAAAADGNTDDVDTLLAKAPPTANATKEA